MALVSVVITLVHCDNAYEPMASEVEEKLNVQLQCVYADAHAPEAKRNIRTLKETFRAEFHRLPFQAIPKIMIQYLALRCAMTLNFFPVKGGISDHYSPHMILNQENINYKRHLSIPFGSYVQMPEETTNTPKARMVDAIYLMPSANVGGGHQGMSQSRHWSLYQARHGCPNPHDRRCNRQGGKVGKEARQSEPHVL